MRVDFFQERQKKPTPLRQDPFSLLHFFLESSVWVSTRTPMRVDIFQERQINPTPSRQDPFSLLRFFSGKLRLGLYKDADAR